MGFDKLPICMAKTQYSFSHDATKKGEVGVRGVPWAQRASWARRHARLA